MAKRKRQRKRGTAKPSRTGEARSARTVEAPPGTELAKRRTAKRMALAAAALAVCSVAVYFVRDHLLSQASETAHRAVADAMVATPRLPSIDASTAPVAAYVGSEHCADCHDKEFAGWKTSWHARALAVASPKTIVGDFHDAHFAGTSNEAWMQRTGAASMMRTRGVDGALADFPIDYVIGGKRMQDDVTVFPDGRWQVLPVYFHVADRSWVDYTEAKQGALSPDHPFYWTNGRRMANHECLDCHTTGLRVDYDATANKWQTTFADGSVACEDCHGAGSIHVASSAKGDIVHPVKSGKVGMAACARCHGPRRPLFPLLDADDQFRLGDDYDELYDPIVVTMPDGGDSTDYFVDGKPKTSSFEYQAMLQSQCYRKGGMDCLTCHTAPHDAKHRKAELRAEPDELCGKCHAEIRAAGTKHSHHKTATCIACHMAPVVSGVLDQFADHSIDVPVPQNTGKHGVPNACGVCHPGKTTDELVKVTDGWWPEARARQARRMRLADAFDRATSKDSLKPLLAVISDELEAPTLRGAAAIVLARRAGPNVAPVLLKLIDDPSVVIRAKVIEALAAAKATAAGDALARHLVDRSLRVRLAAALALRDVHDPRGYPALQQLADDPGTAHLMLPHDELAQAAGARKDWPVAKHELEWVVKLSPTYVEAIVQLGAVERELGNIDGARRRVQQALQLQPNDREALVLRKLLDGRH